MQTTTSPKHKAIGFFLDKGILLSDDVVEIFGEGLDLEAVYSSLKPEPQADAPLILSKDIHRALSRRPLPDINWRDLEKARANYERGKNKSVYKQFLGFLEDESNEEEEQSKAVSVSFSYSEEPHKREVRDFVSYFNVRFRALSTILMSRPELRGATSIKNIAAKGDRASVSVIGIVVAKRQTKNQNIMVTLEDPTGTTNVLINKNKPELYDDANTLVLDEVVGVAGVSGENIVFANSLLWPDTINKKLAKSEEPGHAIFLSDLHVGSSYFLPDAFKRFLSWINLESGSEEQKSIARDVKYMFIAGDLVDGVGIYPNQDEELSIKDIYGQYEEVAKLLAQVPKHIPIIICPGNHDAMRIAEPQPALYEDFAKGMAALPNVTLVSNPSLITIHQTPTFAGFRVLLYHGYSFDYYVAAVDSIRNNGGYDRADLVMKFLLKRRHLAPTHTSTLYLPTKDEDHLVISKVPDFLVSGHIHKSAVSQYHSTTLICGSCWQSTTPFQEKVGHHPEPGRIPVVNLQTREVKILKFV